MIYGKQLIVKVMEEESDDSYLVISIPLGRSEEDFEKDFKTGVKYSQAFADYEDYLHGRKQNETPFDYGYDEHFEEMADIRESVNGEEAFIIYMEKLGYKVKPISADYEFAW